MKIIFMGTPSFAVKTLEAIKQAGHEVVLVVTQPDKPFGRGKKIKKSEVKVKAEELGLEVFQPEKIKRKEAVEKLDSYDVDLIVVVAYGQILSKKILDIPRLGCVNVHASLLPKLRGAAPINWSIINGDDRTGVTTMMMDVGLDTGDMLLSEECHIDENMNAAQLNEKLSIMGADLLSKTLRELEFGDLNRVEQNHAEHTYAPMLDKELAKIDWNDSTLNIHNKVRGLNPDQVAWFNYDGKKFKVYETEKIIGKEDEEAGTVLSVDKKGLNVATGDGIIRILEMQAQGKKRMKASDYLRGNKIDCGEKLV